jgi:hypothetical protein
MRIPFPDLSVPMRIALILCLSLAPAAGSEEPPRAEPETAEAVVRALYDLVTFEAGATPEWDRVRSLFVEEAVVVLRTSREKSTLFSVEGFVEDFVRFIEQGNVGRTGFQERILRLRPTVFGDIAHVLVLYEATIPGSSRPPQKGVDSFHLARRDGRWRIVSILNEVPTPERPLPDALAR